MYLQEQSSHLLWTYTVCQRTATQPSEDAGHTRDATIDHKRRAGDRIWNGYVPGEVRAKLSGRHRPTEWLHQKRKRVYLGCSEGQGLWRHEANVVQATSPVLAYFDPRKDVVIQCDASQKGLGAVLVQDRRLMLYASRCVTSAEQNYAQIEKRTARSSVCMGTLSLVHIRTWRESRVRPQTSGGHYEEATSMCATAATQNAAETPETKRKDLLRARKTYSFGRHIIPDLRMFSLTMVSR